jgi:hypothetical protein
MMVSIRVSGPAEVFDFQVDGDDPPVVEDPAILATLDGLEHDEVFSDYIADSGDPSLVDAGISGGRLYFVFDPKRGVLFGVTEYTAPRLLSAAELAALKEYTLGQWSDGIGSNFLQERMREGLAPQLPFMDDETVTIEQG